MEAPPVFGELRKGAKALVAACRISDGLIRITLTAPQGTKDGSLAITARELPMPPARVALHVSTSVRRATGPLSACKTLSRVAESVAFREAQALGAFDGVLLNEAGRVVETSARNIFVSVDGRLLTPPASEGALEGVTRDAALELAATLGVPASETPLPLETIERADELFLTGSGVGILGVARIGSKAFTTVPGPHSTELAKAYATLLDLESRW